MKMFLGLLIFSLLVVFSAEAKTKNKINDHEVVVKTQIEETKDRNMELRRRYDQAREDAIIFVALIGNSVSAEKRESIHKKMFRALDESLRRLNWNMLVLEEADEESSVGWKVEYIEQGLVEVAEQQMNVERVFDIVKAFREDMEAGNFDVEILKKIE